MRAQAAKGFAPYTGCRLPDGPGIVETAPFLSGTPGRTLQLVDGSYMMAVQIGRRVMFAYRDEDFYANVTVEILPQDGYAASRKALIGNFEYQLASGDNARNSTLNPQLNGFDIRGFDHTKREGVALGIYLLFDDPTRTVTTIYFLNQEPPKRFKTMEEYATLRDQFLGSYTTCIRESLRAASGSK